MGSLGRSVRLSTPDGAVADYRKLKSRVEIGVNDVAELRYE